MKIKDRKIKGILHEVLHVPGLVKNLFLIRKTTIQALKIQFEQDGRSIKNNVREVLQKLYKRLAYTSYYVHRF